MTEKQKRNYLGSYKIGGAGVVTSYFNVLKGQQQKITHVAEKIKKREDEAEKIDKELQEKAKVKRDSVDTSKFTPKSDNKNTKSSKGDNEKPNLNVSEQLSRENKRNFSKAPFNIFDSQDVPPFVAKPTSNLSFEEALAKAKKEEEKREINSVKPNTSYYPSINKQLIDAEWDEISSKYDPQIDELQNRIQNTPQIIEKPYISSTGATLSYSAKNPEYEKLQTQLSDLIQEKNSMIQQSALNNSPEEIRRRNANAMFRNNPAYKKLKDDHDAFTAKYNTARDTRREVEGLPGVYEVRWNINGKDEWIRLDQLNRIARDEYEKYSDKENQISAISDYIAVNGLPTSQLDFILPELYSSYDNYSRNKDTSFGKAIRSLFTSEDGKDLLKDKNYRREFYGLEIIDEEHIPQIAKSNVASMAAAIKAQPSMEQLDETLEEAEYLNKISSNANDKKWSQTNMASAKLAINEAKRNLRLYNDIKGRKHLNDFVEGALNLLHSHLDHWSSHYNEDGKLQAGDFMLNIGGYQSDLINAAIDIDVNRALNKSEDQRSYNDKMLLRAAGLKDMYQSVYNPESLSNMYKWGGVSAQSLDFMAQFIATAGVGNVLREGGKRIGTKVASSMLRKSTSKELLNAATGLVTRNTAKIAEHKLAAYALKTGEWVGRIAGEGAYSIMLGNTLQFVRTADDTIKDMNGTIIGHVNPITGKYQIDSVEDRKSFGEAVILNQKRQFVENFSEQMGEWGLGKLLGKVTGTGKAFNALGAAIKKKNQLYLLSVASKMTSGNMTALEKLVRKGTAFRRGIINKEMLKKGQFSGYFGETAEEFYGIALNHMLGSEDNPELSWLEDTKEQALDIFGGMAVSTGLLGMIGMGSARYHMHKYNNAKRNLEKAYGKETAAAIERNMIFADMNSINGLLASQLSGLNATKGERKSSLFGLRDKTDWKNALSTALTEYYGALLQYRGAAFGEDLIEAGITNKHELIRRRMKDAGYHQADAETIDAADGVKEIFKQRLAEQFGIAADKVDNYIERQGGIQKLIDAELERKNPDLYSNQVLNALLAYDNINQFRDGNNIRMIDDAKDVGRRAEMNILRLVHSKTNKIQPITNKNGVISYLIYGDVKHALATIKDESEDSETTKTREVRSIIADEDMYPNDAVFVISDGNGNRRKLTLSEFVDEFDGGVVEQSEKNPDALAKAVGMYAQQQALKTQAEYFATHDGLDIGKSLKIKNEGGDIVDVTIVGFDGRGVRFAEKDGEGNTSIRYASKQLFDDMINGRKEKATQDLTKLFDDAANQEIQDLLDKSTPWEKQPSFEEEKREEKPLSRKEKIKAKVKEKMDERKAARKAKKEASKKKKEEKEAKKAAEKEAKRKAKEERKKAKEKKAEEKPEEKPEEKIKTIVAGNESVLLNLLDTPFDGTREEYIERILLHIDLLQEQIDELIDEEYLVINLASATAVIQKALNRIDELREEIEEEARRKAEQEEQQREAEERAKAAAEEAERKAKEAAEKAAAETEEAKRKKAEEDARKAAEAAEAARKAAEEAERVRNDVEDGKIPLNPQAPTVDVYASHHKIITVDQHKADIEALKAKLRGQLGANPMLDPEMHVLLIKIALFHIEGGIRKFADFCKSIKVDLSDMFEDVRPGLRSMYMAAKMDENFADIRDQFDSEETVLAFDVNNFDKTNADDKDPQKTTIRTLEEDIAKRAKEHKGTSSYHYFVVREDGSIELARRVHSIYGNMRENWETDKALHQQLEALAERLIQAYSNGYDTFAKLVAEEVKRYVSVWGTNGNYYRQERNGVAICRRSIWNSLSLPLYKQYLQQEGSDIKEIALAISTILTEKPMSPSVINGNVLDTLGRLFFDHKRDWQFTYENVKALKTDVAGVEVNGEVFHVLEVGNEGAEEQQSLMSKDTFNDIVAQFEAIKSEFDKKGWVLITDNYYLTANINFNGSNMLIGGATDMLAVDNEGNVHIVDFKTYNTKYSDYTQTYIVHAKTGKLVPKTLPYTTKQDNTVQQGEKDARVSNLLFVKNSSENTESIDSRSQGAQYARQQAAYKLMLQICTGLSSASENLLMFGLKHKKNVEGAYPVYIFNSEPVKKIGGHTQQLLVPEYKIENDEIVPVLNEDGTPHMVPNLIQVGIDYLASLPETSFGEKKALEDVKLFMSRIGKLLNGDEQRKVDELKEYFISLGSYRGKISQDLIDRVNAHNVSIQNAITNVNSGINVGAVPTWEERTELINLMDLEAFAHDRRELEERLRKQAIEDKYNQYDASNYDILFEDAIEVLIEANSPVTTYSNGAETQVQQQHDDEYLAAIVKYINETEDMLKYLLEHKTSEIDEDLYSTIERYVAIRNEAIGTWNLQDQITEINNLPDRVTIFSSAKKDKGYSDFVEKEGQEYNLASSTAADGTKLYDVMVEPDFLSSEHTEFEVTKEEVGHGTVKFYVTVTYKGKAFSKVQLYTSASNYRSLNDKFNSIPAGEKVYLDVSCIARTNGLFVNNKDGENKLFDYFISTERKPGMMYLYDIEYSADQKTFARTARKQVAGKPCVVATTPSKTGETVGSNTNTVHVYSEREDSNPTVGGVVMMVDVNQNEKIGTPNSKVPINLNTHTFEEGDAQLVLDIIMGKYTNSTSEDVEDFLQEKVILNKGKQNETEVPITNGELLNFLINYGQPAVVVNGNIVARDVVHIKCGILSGRKYVDIRGRIQGVNTDKNGITVKRFYLDSQMSMNLFKGFLMQYVRTNINDSILASRFDTRTDIMDQVFDYPEMAAYVADHGPVLFGNSNVGFDEEDFKQEHTGHKPISGLGWYIKHGYLQSPFENKFERPRMSAGNKGHLKYTTQKPAAHAKKEAAVQGGVKTPSGFANVRRRNTTGNQSLMKRDPDYEMKAKEHPIVEQEAVAHILELLGEVPVGWKSELLSSAYQPACLGRCFADCIMLSRKGYAGIEYHEAFHRILELLTPENERKKIYDTYKKLYEKHNNRKVSDKKAAELLADLFMEFMNNRGKYDTKLHWKIWKTISGIYHVIKFMHSIGSVGLVRFFMAAKDGRFKDVKPTEEQIERFNKFAGKHGLAYEINGKKSNTIVNEEQFQMVVNSLATLMLSDRTQYVDDRGWNVKKLKSDRTTMLYSPMLMEWFEDDSVSAQGLNILIEVLGIKVQQEEDGRKTLVFDYLEGLEVGLTLKLNINDEVVEVTITGFDGDTVHYSYTSEGGKKKTGATSTRAFVDANKDKVKQTIDGEDPRLLGFAADESSDMWERTRPHLDKFVNQFGISSHSNIDDFLEYLNEQEGILDFREEKSPEPTTDEEEGATSTTNVEGNEQGEAAGFNAIAEHDDKDLYSAITKASAQVKFFFSRIIKTEFVAFKDSHGNRSKEERRILNDLGLPMMWDFKEAWARVLMETHDCDTVHKLLLRLHEKSQEEPLFRRFYERFKTVYLAAYDFQGKTADELRQDPEAIAAAVRIGIKDSDAYGFLNQIVAALRCQKANYGLIQGLTHDTGDGQVGSVRMIDPNSDYVSSSIRHLWMSTFAAGVTTHVGKDENGRFYVKDAQPGDNLENNVFTRDVENLKKLRLLLQRRADNNPFKIEEDGKFRIPNIDDWSDMHDIKRWFCEKLHDYGISLSIDELNFALRDFSDAEIPLLAFMEHDDNFESLLNGIGHIKNVLYNNADSVESLNSKGLTAEAALESMWGNNKRSTSGDYRISTNLASAKYRYLQSFKETSVLTVAGKRRYIFTEPNYLTDRLDELFNDATADPALIGETLSNFMKDSYYLRYDPKRMNWSGSRILKNLLSPNPMKLDYVGIPGFKTNVPGNEGIEFLSESEVEDYVSKYALLAENAIIAPTMSDKTSWGVIRGLAAFGFDFTIKRSEGDNNTGYRTVMQRQLGSRNAYKVTRYEDGTFGVQLPEHVVKLFLEYAECEYNQVKDEIARGVKDIDDESVEFFHRGQEVTDSKGEKHVVQQGKRLGAFSGIHAIDNIYDEQGRLLYKQGDFIDFNKLFDIDGDTKTWVSEEDNIKIAEKYFFNLDNATKLKIVEQELNYAIKEELDKLVEKGIIKELGDGAYTNVSLDRVSINKMGIWQNESVTENSGLVEFDGEKLSNAIIGYVADMTVKQQMSMAEISRVYYGNIAYYKWRYDEETGEFMDSTTDLFKRLGGLVSTGKNNVGDALIQDRNGNWHFAETFNVIEVEDIELGSGKQIVNEVAVEFQKMAMIQELKTEYAKRLMNIKHISFDDIVDEHGNIVPSAQKIVDEINETVENMSEAQLREELGDNTCSVLQALVDDRAKAINGTNVTDGATYISSRMAKALLIQNGRYSKQVEAAFELLESTKEEDQKNIRAQAKALNTVTTAFIGMQKYTGYGQRAVTYSVTKTDENGREYTEERVANETFYDKTAYAPLFRCTTSGPLRLLYEAMEAADIHMLKMHSAIKNGSKKVHSITKEDFEKWKDMDHNTAVEQLTKQFTDKHYAERFKDIRQQFNTDPKEEEYMSFGTQAIKVLMNALEAHQKFDVDGVTLYAPLIRNMIMDNIVALSELGQKEVEDLYMTDGKFDEEKFTEFLRKSISDRDASNELLEAIHTVEKTDETGNKTKLMATPLCALSNTNWIQSIIASKINKKMIDVVTPGAAFYQRSIWGMEGKTLLKEGSVGFTINGGRKLQMWNKDDRSTDIVLSIDFFDSFFKAHKHLRFNSFEEKKAFLIKNGIISGFTKLEDDYVWQDGDLYESEDGIATDIPSDWVGKTVSAVNFSLAEDKKAKRKWKNATANIVGYRIPTQAVSSIHAMRCVDVLPVLRHTIIMPEEITAVTGSDFDIDKFFLNMLEYKYVEVPSVDGKHTTRMYTSEIEYSDNMSDKDKKIYHRNQIIKGLLAILRSTDLNMMKLHGSIDSDTKPLKAQAKEIDKASGATKRLSVYSATSMWRNVEAKMDFATGKSNLGTFALNNNSHALCVLYGVNFHEGLKNELLVKLGLTKLSKTHDRYGHSISSWISGLINAHVDVAKDAYIRRLGVNSYSSNLVNLLIRTGFGKDTFWFTTLPIMKKIYDAHITASGVYNQDESVSQYTRCKIEAEKAFIDYVVNNKFYDETKGVLRTEKQARAAVKSSVVDRIMTRYKERHPESATKITFEQILQAIMAKYEAKFKGDKSILHTIATTPEAELVGRTFDLVNDFDITYEEVQAVVGVTNFELQVHAQQLSNLVKYTKIDTKKHGKTLIEQQSYLDGYNALIDPNSTGFDIKGVERMCKRSFIEFKTKHAIQQMNNMVGGQLFEGTTAFKIQIDKLKAHMGSSRNDVSFTNTLVSMLQYNIKRKFFFDGFDGQPSYCARRGIDPTGLLSGKDSIYTKLVRIKHLIEDVNDPTYADMRNENGTCNNYLIKNLVSSITTSDLIDYTLETDVEGRPVSTPSSPNDAYRGAKFVTVLNKFEDGVKSDLITAAWREMLNDSTHPELQRFAEELVVYAFLTSGDTGGAADMFKYVPVQWRNGESSCLFNEENGSDYSSYCRKVLNLYKNGVVDEDNGVLDATIDMSEEEMDDLILSFAWDDNVISTATSRQEDNFTKIQPFDDVREATYILGGQYYTDSTKRDEYGTDVDVVRRSFYDKNTPRFFKLSRYPGVRNGQRQYVYYQLVGKVPVTVASYSTKDGKKETKLEMQMLPIYGIVDPRGGRYGRGHKIFDLGVPNVLDTHSDVYALHRNVLSHFVNLDVLADATITNTAQLWKELMFQYAVNQDQLRIEEYPEIAERLNEFIQRSTVGSVAEDLKKYVPATRRQLLFEERQELRDSYTNLNLGDTVDSRYKLVTVDQLPTEVQDLLRGIDSLKVDLQTLNKRGIHTEFYKRKSENGSSHNYVLTFSLNNKASKGWFELVINFDKESGNVSFNKDFTIRFNTMSNAQFSTAQENEAVAQSLSKDATVPMNTDEKRILFENILWLLPFESTITAEGEITIGGMHAMENLGRFSTSVAPLDETFWNTTKDQDGNDVTVPRWKKLNKKERETINSKGGVASTGVKTMSVGGHTLTTNIDKLYSEIEEIIKQNCGGALPF